MRYMMQEGLRRGCASVQGVLLGGLGVGALQLPWWLSRMPANVGINALTAWMMIAAFGSQGRDNHASASLLHQSSAGHRHEEAL